MRIDTIQSPTAILHYCAHTHYIISLRYLSLPYNINLYNPLSLYSTLTEGDHIYIYSPYINNAQRLSHNSLQERTARVSQTCNTLSLILRSKPHPAMNYETTTLSITRTLTLTLATPIS